MMKNDLFHGDYAKLLWILFGVLLVIILFNSLNRSFDHDEFEAIHSAWKILQGEKIYVDFFQHHHPFLYYLLAPMIAILGENTTTIIAIRIMNFFMLILIFVVTYSLSIKIFDKHTGIISLLLLSTAYIFIEKAIEIRPDVPQSLFGLLSLFFLFTYFEDKLLKHLIRSALFLGISFLFLQKASLLIFLIGAVLLANSYKKHISYRHLLVFLFAFLLSVVPYYFYLLYSNSLFPYFVFNWILNMKSSFNFLGSKHLLKTYQVNTMLWVFYGIGLLFFLKTLKQKQIAILSMGLLVFALVIYAPYRQYFMIAIPLVAMISAYTLHSVFRKNARMMIMVLILSVAPPSCFLLAFLIRPAKYNNSKQLTKIEYVLSITDPEDFVYDGNIQFNVFRKDLDFFWYSVGPNHNLVKYRTMGGYEYNIYKLIDKIKPKIISNYHIENMKDERIHNHYAQSNEYEDLFIRIDSE